YLINQLDWYLFGPAGDVYSFRHLVLPRIVAGMVCTMPPILAACWSHSGPPRSRITIRWWMAIVAACAVVLALVRWPALAGVLAISGLLANSYLAAANASEGSESRADRKSESVPTPG